MGIVLRAIFCLQKSGSKIICSFLPPLSQNRFLEYCSHDENCHERQNNPSEKHCQNNQRPKNKTKPAFPDGGKSSPYCSLQPFLRNGSDCRGNSVPDACNR